MFLVRMRVISEICEYQIKYKSFENSVEIFPYNRKLFYKRSPGILRLVKIKNVSRREIAMRRNPRPRP